MALNSQHTTWRFLSRLAGMTGVFLVIVGLALFFGVGARVAGLAVAGVGAALAVLGLVGELHGLAGMAFSRRGAVGGSVLLQIALGAILVAGVNIYSFNHYRRFDWTRDGTFTLDKKIRDQLAALQGDTNIVVYKRHTPFGQTADNRQDNYDAAAQRQIVEKVVDLVELFQDLGPRFRVQVLDMQDGNFEKKLPEIRKEAPLLAEAIEKAPDDTIFFHVSGPDPAKDRVQRLSFHDIYQLDKTASQKDNDGAGNLVLHYQGVGAFANKILNIEEKKPRIGFAVVHEFMGVEGPEQIGMAGVKKALEARGFDCRDIILKQWPQQDPAVLTHDEHKHERLDVQLTALERNLKDLEEKNTRFTREQVEFEKLTLAELEKKYVIVMTGPFGDVPYAVPQKELEAGDRYLRINREDVRAFYLQDLKETLEKYQTRLKKLTEARDKTLKEKQGLAVENLDEIRRITDLGAKFNRMLADCDLLVLPRQTMFDLSLRWSWPMEIYKLDPAQLEALQDFLKSGKPVMFCLGPPNEPGRPGTPTGDDVEKLLASLGIELPSQAILFNSEAELLETWQQKMKVARAPEVPPVELEWQTSAARLGKATPGAEADLHPVRNSLRLSARGFSKNYPSDLKVRTPRPVYAMTVSREATAAAIASADCPLGFGPLNAAMMLTAKFRQVDDRAVILQTSADSWNDDQPFPTDDRIPRLERGKDPNRGTFLEKREGPFPIAVALETRLPQAWYEDKQADPAKVRLVVLGHGGVFMGENLTPMKEKLLLDTTNWLLGRDDLLARDREVWSFPRVHLSERCKALWSVSAWLLIPLVFVFLGQVMWLVRRMR